MAFSNFAVSLNNHQQSEKNCVFNYDFIDV